LCIQLAQTDRVQFHFRRTPFSSQLKNRVGLVLAKAADLRITLSNLDGVPITSKSHTHPSHSQTSRLLTLTLSSSFLWLKKNVFKIFINLFSEDYGEGQYDFCKLASGGFIGWKHGQVSE
jgi:hypothetical protein